MFLRANKRFKDGKTHLYWSVVENRRVAGGRTVQKTLLYLGEINDSDRASWTRAIEAVDGRDETRQILFPGARFRIWKVYGSGGDTIGSSRSGSPTLGEGNEVFREDRRICDPYTREIAH